MRQNGLEALKWTKTQWLGTSLTLPELNLDAYLVSTGIVALAEMGDMTQITTVMLAHDAGGLAGRQDHQIGAIAGGARRVGANFFDIVPVRATGVARVFALVPLYKSQYDTPDPVTKPEPNLYAP